MSRIVIFFLRPLCVLCALVCFLVFKILKYH